MLNLVHVCLQETTSFLLFQKSSIPNEYNKVKTTCCVVYFIISHLTMRQPQVSSVTMKLHALSLHYFSGKIRRSVAGS